MRVWNWPNGTLVESVSRFEFHPVSNRVTDVMIPSTRRMIACTRPHVIATGPKTVSRRAFFPDLSRDMIGTCGRGRSGFAYRGWCYNQSSVSLHDVNHAILKRDFHPNRAWILRFIGHNFVLLRSNGCKRFTTGQECTTYRGS